MPRPSIQRATLLWISATATAVLAADSTCYYPSGDIATGVVPCTNGTNTHCCGRGDICLSNGYCMDVGHQPYVLSRGGCTDSSWGRSCPDRCYGPSDNPTGGCSITNILFVDHVATYCCGTPVLNTAGDAIVCPNSEDDFTIATGTMIAGVAALATSTSASGSGSAVSATTASDSGSTSTSSTTDSNNSSSRPTAVGAGVGVALGVCLVAAIAWAVWERRQRTKLQALSSTPNLGPETATLAGGSTAVGGAEAGLGYHPGKANDGRQYRSRMTAATPYQSQGTGNGVARNEGFGVGAHELGVSDRMEMADTEVRPGQA